MNKRGIIKKQKVMAKYRNCILLFSNNWVNILSLDGFLYYSFPVQKELYRPQKTGIFRNNSFYLNTNPDSPRFDPLITQEI